MLRACDGAASRSIERVHQLVLKSLEVKTISEFSILRATSNPSLSAKNSVVNQYIAEFSAAICAVPMARCLSRDLRQCHLASHRLG
jgi:hypothetical protein